MKNSKFVKVVLIIVTIFIIAACNLPFLGTAGGGQDEETNTSEEPLSLDNDSEEEVEIDPNPVGLQAGLGSLDSYQIRIYVNTYDSTGMKSEYDEYIEREVLEKNSHSITTQTSFDPEYDTEESTSTSETYLIGNATCSGSDGEWTYEEMSAQDKEMMDVFKGMVDFLPLIDNPEFVGEENINGIDCNHFMFQVAGIGDTSGSIATINEGDYWLARDGQYIVKYHLLLEVQSAADGAENVEVSNIEALIDLTNVNVPLNLSMPAEYCYPGAGVE